MKTIERPPFRIVDSENIHIWNGGYVFRLVQYEQTAPFKEWTTSLEISEGFHGWAESTLSLFEKITPETLEKLGEFFLRSAKKLRKIGLCREGE